MRDFSSWPGVKPAAPEGWVLTTGPPGGSPTSVMTQRLPQTPTHHWWRRETRILWTPVSHRREDEGRGERGQGLTAPFLVSTASGLHPCKLGRESRETGAGGHAGAERQARTSPRSMGTARRALSLACTSLCDLGPPCRFLLSPRDLEESPGRGGEIHFSLGLLGMFRAGWDHLQASRSPLGSAGREFREKAEALVTLEQVCLLVFTWVSTSPRTVCGRISAWLPTGRVSRITFLHWPGPSGQVNVNAWGGKGATTVGRAGIWRERSGPVQRYPEAGKV